MILKSEEEKLFEVIYSQDFAEKKKKALTLLKNLGYKVVTNPLARDLVVYGDTKPMHWGLMTSKTMVISKWGHGYVWKHGLDKLPSFYGKFLGFLRRPEKKK